MSKKDNTSGSSVVDNLQSVVSGGMLIFCGKLLGLAVGFLTQLIMARVLSPDAYGSVVLAMAVISITRMLAKLGLDDGVVRKFPEFEDDLKKAGGVIRSSLKIGVISGTSAGIILFIIAPVLATNIFGKSELSIFLRIGAISLPFTVIGVIGMSLARGARSAVPETYARHIVAPIARFILISALLVGGLGALGALVGWITASIISGLLGLFFAFRELPSWNETSVKRMDRVVLTFSLPLIAVQGMNFLISNTDTFMIGYFLQSGKVGIYNVSFQIRNAMQVPLFASGYLLTPIMTRLEISDKYDEMRTLYPVINKWLLFFALPVLLTLLVFPRQMLDTLFGAGYTSGATALQILATGAFINVALGANAQALIGLNKNKLVTYTTTLAVTTNIILNLILIPTWGITGAAIASTLSIIFQNMANIYFLHLEFGIVALSSDSFRPMVAISLLGTVCYAFLEFSGLTVFTIIVWSFLYPVSIIRYGGIGIQDKRLFERVEQILGVEANTIRYLFDYLS